MKIPWWEWLPFRGWRILGTVESADEIPDRIPVRTMVLVAFGGPPKWVGFRCPCGIGHKVLLNLDQQRQPAWTFTKSQSGKLTILPSVDYRDGRRRCHYFVRDSKVLWAKDTIR